MTDPVIPEGVEPGVAGACVFFSQRIDGKPYVNCMAYSAASQVEFSGLHVPKDFGMTIRHASGVPVKPDLGMSAADVKRGLQVLLPFMHYHSGSLSDKDLMLRTAEGQQFHLMIDFSKVPMNSKLRRFVGSYQGGHAGWIANALQGPKGGYKVLWFDAFAPAGHNGRWLQWSRFRTSVLRHNGNVRVLFSEEGQALMDFPITPPVQAVIDGLKKQVEELTVENEALKQSMAEVATELDAQASKLENASA